MDTLFLYFAAFIWGSLWGSFANVCIHRIPRAMSLVKPPSHCPACQHQINWYHNIPIFSFLLLGGKCSYCGVKISPRYVFVETVMAFLSLAIFVHFSKDPALDGILIYQVAVSLFYFVMAFILVVITFIDIVYFVIPNIMTIAGTIIGLITTPFLSRLTGITFWESLIGATAGGGIMLLFILSYKMIMRREGMGGGDFKLMAMVGAFLGWKSLSFVLLASSLQGIIFALFLKLSGKTLPPPQPFYIRADEIDDEPLPDPPSDEFRHMMLPFGPFIALAALEFLFLQPYFTIIF